MESKASARFARIAPRKARTVVNLVRGRKVADAIDMLLFTRKAAAPFVRKVIESALANARLKNPGIDVDGLYVTLGSVDKGPNKHLRRWRPRAMGRATQVTKGVSHIEITLTDSVPVVKKSYRRPKPDAETTTEAPVTEAAVNETPAEAT